MRNFIYIEFERWRVYTFTTKIQSIFRLVFTPVKFDYFRIRSSCSRPIHIGLDTRINLLRAS
jgi:hypothetical protein